MDLFRTPIVSAPYLYDTIPGPRDHWSRFRRWLEDRYARIGLPYVWPKVRRDRVEPKAVMMGGVLFAHPLLIDHLRRSASVNSSFPP